MKVVYIHQHFVTNEGTAGTRSYDMSRFLVQMGWQVTMVTGTHDQGTKGRLPFYKPWVVEWIDGIKVVHCNAFYSNSLGVPARLMSFVRFAILGLFAVLRERGVDLVFATSTPLTVGIPGRIGAALKRVPYIFEVRDLWPEDLVDAGRIKPGFQLKFWEWLERFSYAKARKILLVSKGFHDRLLERGFAPERLETLVLGADSSLYQNLQPDLAYMQEQGLTGRTVAIYAGAHGDANGLDQVLDAAALLKHRPDIAIAFIGQGKMRERLKARAAAEGLTNAYFLEPVPKHKLPGVLAACHIGLMILKQITRPRWVTPNKIFDYMFTGLPSIVNFAGTTAELVVADGAGVASKPGDAADLAQCIEHWADHPDERAAIGRHARELSMAKYDRKAIATRMSEIFGEVVRGAASAH